MKYYLINNKIMKGSEMPKIESGEPYYSIRLKQWQSSLQSCEISESELEKIDAYIFKYFSIQPEPIDVTDIVEEKCTECNNDGSWINKLNIHGKPFLSCCPDANYKLFFKQPKQVDEEIEAVEFLEWIIKNEYYYNGKHWHKDFQNKLTTKQLYEIFKNRK